MRFEADERARKVNDLEHMIREFEIVAADLERQIKAEEERTGVRDASHFNYSTFARSAAQRRENLLASAAGLKTRLEDAIRARDEYLDQMNRLATVEQRPTTTGPGRGGRPRSNSSQTSQLR